MEDVLEIYKRPYNSAVPVICMDEQPTPLIMETRRKIAVEPGKPERVCLDRRIPDMATLQQEAKAWYRKRNDNQKAVDWQFTTEDARVKLKSLYPHIQML